MGAPIKDLFAHYKVDANGCWIWQGSLKSTGYGVSVRHGKTKSMHRAFYEHHIGPIPEGLLVCHKCDVRNCVNPEHLFVGTNLDNIRDAMAKGRLSPTPKGESHNRAKLTEADVIEIRRLSANGWATKVLAKHYLMHSKTIRALLNGQNWKNVQPPAGQQDSGEQLLGMYAVQADEIKDLLDKHAPNTTGNLQTRIAQILQPTAGGEPIAWTVAGGVTDWTRDFSAYQTKTYTRPVYLSASPPPAPPREPLTEDEILDRAATFGFGFGRMPKDYTEAMHLDPGGRFHSDQGIPPESFIQFIRWAAAHGIKEGS